MQRRLVAFIAMVLAATVAPVSLASTAQASSAQCATSATITHRSGSGTVIWHKPPYVKGRGYYIDPTDPGKVYTAKTIGRTGDVQWFELHGVGLSLSFGGNSFALAPGTIFFLACSGVSRAQGAIMPTIDLMSGQVHVATTSRVLGSAISQEGLFGPVTSNPAMTYVVTRVLAKKSPNFSDKVNFAFGYSNQPAGTTSTRTTTAGRLVNVTPYVGPGIGHCRHVNSAALKSTSWEHGTAVYHF